MAYNKYDRIYPVTCFYI